MAIEILKGKKISNSNWGQTQISFSPTIAYRLEDGRIVTIGYAERQWAAQAPDDAIVGIDDGSESIPDYIEKIFIAELPKDRAVTAPSPRKIHLLYQIVEQARIVCRENRWVSARTTRSGYGLTAGNPLVDALADLDEEFPSPSIAEMITSQRSS